MDPLRLFRRQNQKSQILTTRPATAAAPTPAPIAAFAPVASPCLMIEPCETPATFSVGELLAEDGEVEDGANKGVVVYQCVDVTIVVVVLSPLGKTTIAVLVDSPAGLDVTTFDDDSWTEVVTCVAGVAYIEDVITVVVVYVLEAAALVDDNGDEVDGDTDEVMVEAAAVSCADDALEDVELEEAAQATFRVNCTPLLAQFESNVAAAALHSLAMKHHPGELIDLTLLISTVAT
jgi:hypothetical protein